MIWKSFRLLLGLWSCQESCYEKKTAFEVSGKCYCLLVTEYSFEERVDNINKLILLQDYNTKFNRNEKVDFHLI